MTSPSKPSSAPRATGGKPDPSLVGERLRAEIDLGDVGPAVVPGDRRAEGLPGHRRRGTGGGARAGAEHHAGPGSVGQLDQVAVPGVLDVAIGAAGGHRRVVRSTIERAVGRCRARDRDRVPAFGAAFGDQQVPPLPDVIEVREGVGHERARLP